MDTDENKHANQEYHRLVQVFKQKSFNKVTDNELLG